jgi:hypothetical protein
VLHAKDDAVLLFPGCCLYCNRCRDIDSKAGDCLLGSPLKLGYVQCRKSLENS